MSPPFSRALDMLKVFKDNPRNTRRYCHCSWAAISFRPIQPCDLMATHAQVCQLARKRVKADPWVNPTPVKHVFHFYLGTFVDSWKSDKNKGAVVQFGVVSICGGLGNSNTLFQTLELDRRFQDKSLSAFVGKRV